ncbi:hypothetical protein [Salinibacter ruber]|jgi:hypothetical protein|uniref:hypothetical protein n=1 Tax=Salinibacter ruber TaxID=146919 RepID=UPI0013C2D18B|nr:hypothetical protein [Salinibacter ruber]MCS4187847.1 hypothetical protein [Salinibacter ruber]
MDIEDLGNPNRKTVNQDKEANSAHESSGDDSDGRKTRISVTPQDPEQLEEVANKLGGLPKSKVYNMGFQALLEKLGRD